jgi:hypothetical protein
MARLVPAMTTLMEIQPSLDPEEPRSGVPKDVARAVASWFETRGMAALLTMRI